MAKAIALHSGKNSVVQNVSNKFLWHKIKGSVEEFLKKPDQCQKQGKIKTVSTELHTIPVKLR